MRRPGPRTCILSGLIALSIIGIVGLSPRTGGGGLGGTRLRRRLPRPAAERFVAAADKGDVAAIAAAYDPEFVCVRVADEGGFARLSREQMLGFFGRPAAPGKAAGHAIPTKETTIHHAEVLGDTGYVLLTRIKDLGKGWEPMFYTLVWKRTGGEWHLRRIRPPEEHPEAASDPLPRQVGPGASRPCCGLGPSPDRGHQLWPGREHRAGSAPALRGVEIAAGPEFEHQQRPELVGDDRAASGHARRSAE